MATAAPPRPTAQDFLELVERGKRGRLKLYIGFAAGVGKTWRMLEEAHALRQRGVDVVGAFIETHGRAETEALIRDLEIVPRRKCEYRGVVVEEMDLEAVLDARPAGRHRRRDPPHQRPRRRRNRKRYQDVLDLLDAGINVIGALNIQHLEKPERPRPARYRGACPRDRPRQLPQAGRPGGEPGPRGRGPARSGCARARFTGRRRSPGRWSTSSASQPLHPARAELARGGREPGSRSAAQAERRGEAPGPRRGTGGSWCASPPIRPAPRRCCGAARAWRAASTPTGSWSTSRRRTRRPTGSTPRCSGTCSATSTRHASWAPRWCGSRPRTPSPRCSTSLARTAWATSSSAAPSSPWWKRFCGARSCNGW